MREMVRVAKSNAKILIADETSDDVDKQYEQSGLSRKFFKDTRID